MPLLFTRILGFLLYGISGLQSSFEKGEGGKSTYDRGFACRNATIMTKLTQGSVSKRAPYLRTQGSAKQLIVDGEPFLVLGGELHNSSSSSIEYMRPIWERLVMLNLNTALTPVSWELIEPEEGRFDFTLVDGLLQEARRHNLRLIFLWFGSWKNGMSSYIPLWVKQDVRRFPYVKLQNGQSIEVLSTLAETAREADGRAFAALMQHIRAVDDNDHTVIMMQIENEVGVLGDSRDRCDAANTAFAGQVPQELIDQLTSHRQELGREVRQCWEANGFKSAGSWEEVFGKGLQGDEIFMAWHYARYIDSVAEAGKAEYDIPMFVNAWLSGQKPGEWPSGGPVPHMLEIWQAGAPHIDMLSPDIYLDNFQEWCQRYTRQNNPLFIPEMRHGERGIYNIFYALGEHEAIGVSPFAIDSESSADGALSKGYAILRQLAPLILEYQGKSAMIGFRLDEETPSIRKELGGYELEISLDHSFGPQAERGYGLIIVSGQDEFIGGGYGFMVNFRPTTPGSAFVGIAAADEGEYRYGKWIPRRRLNGDETNQGKLWRFPIVESCSGIERCTLYRYE
ncbi:MAG TPA: DUF5597 domain-containing protein [Ktedonobacteraceae bacterium]